MLKGRSLQYFVVSSAMLNMITSGLHSGWTSPFLSELENDPDMGLTKDLGSWIAAGLPMGGVLGAAVCGCMMDAIGRKKPMVLSASLSIIGWVMIATVRLRYVLLLARLLVGVGNGIISVVIPTYLMEVCDCEVGRVAVLLLNTFFLLGVLLINIFGCCFSLTYASLSCAILPLIFFTMVWRLPESPRFYMMKENHRKAKEVMCQILNKENVDEEIDLFASRHFSFRFFFTDPTYRNSLLACMGMIVVQQCSGIVPIIFYTQAIFDDAIEYPAPIVSVVLFYVTFVLISIVPAITMGLHRSPLLKLSVIGVGLSLLMEGSNLYVIQKFYNTEKGYSWITMGILLIYVVSYCLGLLVVPIELIGHLFPPYAVTAATSICIAFLNVVSSLLVKVFHFTFHSHSLYVSFFVCANCSYLSLVLVTCFISNIKTRTFGDDEELSENAVAIS